MSAAFSLPEAYTFIVTYGRSGSTLVQNLLNTLSGYQIRGENNNALLHLAWSYAAVASNKQMQGMRATGEPSSPLHPWYGAEQVFPEAYGRDLTDVFIRNILRPDPGVRVSGFKEIRFHAETGSFWPLMTFMRDHFPNARFVFNTRDHAAVARSGWWKEHDFEHVEKVLTHAEGLFREFAKYNAEISHALHYDDYVADPGSLKSLFTFLGEEWDPAMVDWVMQQRLEHLQGPKG